MSNIFKIGDIVRCEGEGWPLRWRTGLAITQIHYGDLDKEVVLGYYLKGETGWFSKDVIILCSPRFLRASYTLEFNIYV